MFRKLNANEIDVRIGQIGKSYTTLLLYKNARVDMDVLDETVGASRWQRRHYEIGGNLHCEVAIHFENIGWVLKADVGTESNTEKEKGQASDSFKRACVNWGIGRELYTAPRIMVKNDKITWYAEKKTYDTFSVEKITYKDGVIDGLSIINQKNERIFVKMPGKAE